MKKLIFRYAQGEWVLGEQIKIMGILNVTPDSFSDGGSHFDAQNAVSHGLALAEAGADVLDVGGESTRPGAPEVSAEEESRRVVPVIRALHQRVDIPLSIDTSKAAVAAAAIEAGAAIVNDVSGLQRDKQMLDVVRDSQVGCIIMHMRGTPETMKNLTDYMDLIEDIRVYFKRIMDTAVSHGIDFERIMLDPGIGFAKTAKQNLELIAQCKRFRELDRPILLGPSRKSFIGRILNRPDPQDRMWGTVGAVACCVLNGADVIRVHDVHETKDAALVARAIRELSF